MPALQSWPTPQEGVEIFERLLADDPTASSDLALGYLNPLSNWLIRRNPRVEPHICAEAAENAILTLIKNPSTYKPERLTLSAYLRLSASGDLKNLLQAERRHSSRRANLDAVELSPAMRKYLWDEDADPALLVERPLDDVAENRQPVAVPPSVRDKLTSEEMKVLELMQLGERKTEAYVVALGIADQSVEEQRREVKRLKDRLKKRLERAVDV